MTWRTKKHTNHDLLLTVALAVTALILFSCQKEDIENGSSNHTVTVYPVISSAFETTVQTRSLNTRYTYNEYTGTRQVLTVNAIAYSKNPNAAQDNTDPSVYDVRDTENDKQGVFSPITDGWRSTVECETNHRYYLYAYSRQMPSANNPVFNFTSESDATLTFDGLDIITTNDPLVCIATSGKVLPANPDPSAYPELTDGKFGIGVIPTTVVEGTSLKAFMAFNHLYSKATLSFRIDETYSLIREVRIKDIKIKVNNGTLTGSHVYGFGTQVLDLDNAATTVGTDPAEINLYDGPTHTASPAQEGDEFIALTTSLVEFGYYYFLPLTETPPMYLEVTYDIYDLKGNCVRQNQTAKNSNLFAAISNNGGKPAAGTNYNIKILVKPTYLYQLSDDDLDLGLTIE